MNTRRLFLLLSLGLLTAATVFAQFAPRADYIWARDVAGATITLDGTLSEAAWAKAESLSIQYGVKDGMPGSGWQLQSGEASTMGNPANAKVKFLVDKTKNMLYMAIIAKDSSVGGWDWANSDGINAGFYNRNDRSGNLMPNHQDIFINYCWIAADSGVGKLMDLTRGSLPSNNKATVTETIQGLSQSDTNGVGAKVADQGWTMEIGIKLDSLGYNANSATIQAVLGTVCIWDMDWKDLPGYSSSWAWWGNPWSNNGGGLAGRILMQNTVNVNSGSLPTYPYDLVVPNGVNYADPVVDGDLADAVWSHVPYFDMQFGNAALRAAYPTIGPDRSGEWFDQKSVGITEPFDAGVCRVKMFFKGDKLYVGADVSDQNVFSFSKTGNDLFDGLQLNMVLPIDLLRDPITNVFADKRFGVAIDSLTKGGARGIYDDTVYASAINYGAKLKASSTLDNPASLSTGYTLEMSFDLSKLGYSAGAPNKIVAIGANYHDYDINIVPDTAVSHVWWFHENAGGNSSPAFAYLDNGTVVTAVNGNPTNGLAGEFKLYGNYPNPFNPSTTIRFSVPATGIAKVTVYDILGRMVDATQFSVVAGPQERNFNASRLASGVYFYRLEFVGVATGTMTSQTMKMVLLK
jgi:hypothetical protein